MFTWRHGLRDSELPVLNNVWPALQMDFGFSEILIFIISLILACVSILSMTPWTQKTYKRTRNLFLKISVFWLKILFRANFNVRINRWLFYRKVSRSRVQPTGHNLNRAMIWAGFSHIYVCIFMYIRLILTPWRWVWDLLYNSSSNDLRMTPSWPFILELGIFNIYIGHWKSQTFGLDQNWPSSLLILNIF